MADGVTAGIDGVTGMATGVAVGAAVAAVVTAVVTVGVAVGVAVTPVSARAGLLVAAGDATAVGDVGDVATGTVM